MNERKRVTAEPSNNAVGSSSNGDTAVWDPPPPTSLISHIRRRRSSANNVVRILEPRDHDGHQGDRHELQDEEIVNPDLTCPVFYPSNRHMFPILEPINDIHIGSPLWDLFHQVEKLPLRWDVEEGPSRRTKGRIWPFIAK